MMDTQRWEIVSWLEPWLYTREALKRCSRCKQEWPATAEYFHRKKTSTDGLDSGCKKCAAELAREYYEANREKVVESNREYREANREQIAEHKRANREHIAERKREYREANREQIAEYDRQYREANREQIAETDRQYREANPERGRAASARRRARQRGLPDTFTGEQWIQCLEYFNYCCPVCDNQLRDLFGNVKPHADHWIAISYEGDDNPGTVATNMICLCNDCNQSKWATMPDEWLKQKFGTRKVKQISARIAVYFEWTTAQCRE